MNAPRREKIHSILKETFGYDSFRFDQLKIIESILDGTDTLAIMPTGGGKSVCYQIPALFLDGVTLIISPLISLMQDQVVNLKEYGVQACFLNSSLTGSERYATTQQILQGKIKLVYVSPEGLLSGALDSLLSQVRPSLIAIDEAHCVSQWGHEFRKDYTRLNELKIRFPNVPTLALTATADAKTRADIIQQLAMKSPSVFVSSFDRPNIKYMILERHEELKQLDQFIKANHVEDTGIIYCLSRSKVERVAESLKKMGYPAVAYHAGLSSEERTRAQKRFDVEEKIIVVATIAFGMGIDRPDVRFVAHLDLPKSIEGYYQETGRAGRDGKASNVFMVYGLADVVKLSQMIETSEADENYKKVARYKLDSMLALCEAGTCRRKFLLGYFGEQLDEPCGNCDVCIDPPQLWDATQDSQKVLSTIVKTGQVFGAGHVIDVLRGSKSAKISERGHDKLSVYGIGEAQSKDHWNSVLRQLLNQGYLTIRNWEYRSIGLTERCHGLLKGGEKIHLRKQEGTASTKVQKKSSASSKEALANHGRTELFQALKALRFDLAKEAKVPPYVIFADKTLHEMCLLLPKDPSELLMVSGVGQMKQEKYGAVFLKKIQEHR